MKKTEREMETRRFSSYYEAKATRDQMPKPSDWIIIPDGHFQKLVKIAWKSQS